MKTIILIGILVLLVGCTPGIVRFEIDCSKVDCSCNINEYCDVMCDNYNIRNDQNWDRVEFREKPYCVCS